MFMSSVPVVYKTATTVFYFRPNAKRTTGKADSHHAVFQPAIIKSQWEEENKVFVCPVQLG